MSPNIPTTVPPGLFSATEYDKDEGENDNIFGEGSMMVRSKRAVSLSDELRESVALMRNLKSPCGSDPLILISEISPVLGSISMRSLILALTMLKILTPLVPVSASLTTGDNITLLLSL